MANFLSKFIFFLRKPKVIIITGKGRSCAAEAIFQILKLHFRVKKLVEKTPRISHLLSFPRKKIFIIETVLNPSDRKNLTRFVKSSQLPILIVTNVGEIPSDCAFFSGARQETEEIRKLAKIIPSFGYLVLNFDDEVVREMNDITNLNTLTFGFQKEADFQATDIRTNKGTNFKISYKGTIVPIWLDKLFGKEQIYSAQASSSVGVILGLNFVEISDALKNYKSLPGKMRMIEGIKNSWILDDSESASVFSMVEALEILGKIETEGRKIAVLGDILGIGKYTIEAHERIGEKVKSCADLLFTVGARAKFIAQGVLRQGMPSENIFQFDEIESVISSLKEKIKKGDLILVDGSKEIEMEKIVKEIKV